MDGLRKQSSPVHVVILPLASCVTLGRSPKVSLPVKKRLLTGMPRRSNQHIYTMGLAHSECMEDGDEWFCSFNSHWLSTESGSVKGLQMCSCPEMARDTCHSSGSFRRGVNLVSKLCLSCLIWFTQF